VSVGVKQLCCSGVLVAGAVAPFLSQFKICLI